MVWQRDEYGADYLVGEEAKYDNEDERLAYWQREEQAFEREKEEHAAALREKRLAEQRHAETVAREKRRYLEARNALAKANTRPSAEDKAAEKAEREKRQRAREAEAAKSKAAAKEKAEAKAKRAAEIEERWRRKFREEGALRAEQCAELGLRKISARKAQQKAARAIAREAAREGARRLAAPRERARRREKKRRRRERQREARELEAMAREDVATRGREDAASRASEDAAAMARDDAASRDDAALHAREDAAAAMARDAATARAHEDAVAAHARAAEVATAALHDRRSEAPAVGASSPRSTARFVGDGALTYATTATDPHEGVDVGVHAADADETPLSAELGASAAPPPPVGEEPRLLDLPKEIISRCLALYLGDRSQASARSSCATLRRRGGSPGPIKCCAVPDDAFNAKKADAADDTQLADKSSPPAPGASSSERGGPDATGGTDGPRDADGPARDNVIEQLAGGSRAPEEDLAGTAPAARADADSAVTAKTVSNPGADTGGPPQTRGAGPTPTRTSSTAGAVTMSEPSSSSSAPTAVPCGPPDEDEPRDDTNDTALNGDDAAPDGIGAAMASGAVDAARCVCSGLAAAALRVVCCLNKPSWDEEGCDSDDAWSSDDEPTSSASKAGTPRLFFTYFGGDARLLGGTRDQETEAEPTGLHDSEQKMNLNLTWPASMASMASS